MDVLLDCQSAQRAAAEASRKRAAEAEAAAQAREKEAAAAAQAQAQAAAAAQAQAEASSKKRAAADDSDRKMSDGGRKGGAAPTLSVWRRLVCLCASACLHRVSVRLCVL